MFVFREGGGRPLFVCLCVCVIVCVSECMVLCDLGELLHVFGGWGSRDVWFSQ